MRNEGELILWRSFTRGDWDAYSSLYDAYFGLLNNYGHKFTRETALIEDAVHDLFLRLWTSRERLNNPASVKNYLFKSMRNVLLRKMKREEKFTDIDGHEYPLTFSVSYGGEIIRRIEEQELAQKVKAFINSLPSRQQEIVYLRFYEGLGYEEIADVMSISINSTYKLLYKALDSLQKILGPSYSLSLILCLGIPPYFFSA